MFGQCAGDVDERTVGHRGHDGGHTCLVPADPGVDDGRTGAFDVRRQRHRLLPALAVLHVVGHRHPVADDELAPNGSAGPRDDLHRHAPAFFGRSAPCVETFVGPGREELVEQVALTAHDLDAVVAGVASQHGAPDEVVDGLLDAPGGQRARAEGVDGGLDRRGTDREGVICVAAGVQDLQQYLAAGIVHRRGDAPVPLRFLRRHQLRGERQQPAGVVRGVAPGDDQPDAAAGAFGEVLGQSPGVTGAVLQAGVHRSHDDPVAQGGETEIQR